MKALRYFLRGILCLILPGSAVLALSQEEASWLKQSSIVFTGTVVQVGAVSFAEVPASAQTMVVRVDSVLKKPAAISLKKNDQVTVEAKDPAAFQEGRQARFYTDGWIFGSGVAVKEMGHVMTPEGTASATASAASFGQIQTQVNDQDLQERLNAADAVVIGRVIDIRPWTAPASAAATAVKPVSEHSTEWKEAVIQVQSALKGTDAKQIVVRFPTSQDVAWVNSPKFQKDQAGTFVLKADQVSGSSKAMMAGVEVTAFTALKSEDVLSAADATRARVLLHK